jgi:5-formyltetrahydrofolate cyclo-ligase
VGTSDTDSSAAKAAARDEARARRRSGARPDPRALADRAMALLEDLPGPRRVTCYASYGTEPDTGELRSRLAAAGYDVLLPRVRGDDLEWVVDGPDSTLSSMGIAEPVGATVDLIPVRAMLIPALAATPDGDRLGKGGGYYDRVLDLLGEMRPPVAAIVGDADVVDALPTDAHDQRVDAIVTPTRIVSCAMR